MKTHKEGLHVGLHCAIFFMIYILSSFSWSISSHLHVHMFPSPPCSFTFLRIHPSLKWSFAESFSPSSCPCKYIIHVWEFFIQQALHTSRNIIGSIGWIYTYQCIPQCIPLRGRLGSAHCIETTIHILVISIKLQRKNN